MKSNDVISFLSRGEPPIPNYAPDMSFCALSRLVKAEIRAMSDEHTITRAVGLLLAFVFVAILILGAISY